MSNLPQDGESERLAALHAYGILDTPPEPGFEHTTAMVTRLLGMPIAAVTLVDAERQWFKSVRGLDVRESPRKDSFCAHAMLGHEVMVVPDATLDPRFADNPLVTGEPGIRFYAGMPLRTPEGHPLGALCVIDRVPRAFSSAERQLLAEMAALGENEVLVRGAGEEPRVQTHALHAAETALEDERYSGELLRMRLQEPPEEIDKRQESGEAVEKPTPAFAAAIDQDRFRHVIEQADDALFVYDMEGRFLEANPAACKLVGYSRQELLQLYLANIEISFDPAEGRKRWQEMTVGGAVTMEGLGRRKDGSTFSTEARVSVVETAEGRHMLALVRDTTERKRAELALQARARQQRAVARLGVKALQGEATQPLLNEAVRVVGETLNLEICRVLQHLPERAEFVTRAGLNLPDKERDTVAATDSPAFAAGHVLRSGEPVIIRNVLDDHRFKPTPWLLASGAVSGMHVAIGGDSAESPRYGIFAAYTSERREFSEDDVYFVQAVANVLGAAMARQRVEDALRVVEARYQRIAANTPGVVYQYMVRSDGTRSIPFISDGCRAFYGLSPEEVQATPKVVFDAIHADDRPSFKAAIHTAESTLTPLHWQGRLVLPSGQVRWVRFDSRPEQQADGAVICDGMIVDVTEEEERKEAQRQSEERFRLANLHAPFPIMLFTDDGEVLQVNDAWVHLSGYTEQELGTVEDWLRLAYPSEEKKAEIRDHLANFWRHVGARNHPGHRIRCAGGEERIWDISAATLGRLPNGRWLRIVTAVDVTERDQQERELRAAKSEAERANTAKSKFLSRMSHELRTPLNAILGFGQLLEMSQLADTDYQAVDHILKGGRHLLTLVDEVLDLARVETGEIALKIVPVSLDRLAVDCTGLVSRLAEARGVTCLTKAARHWQVPVLADEQRLRQVLLNLLSNAIKYNREGGQVSLAYEKMSGNRLRLSVADTGTGIPEEAQSHLFVPFNRLGQEFGEVEGTGLGLVVSKQLMEAMGGQLGVESEVGKGSTFWLELPAVPETDLAAARANAPAAGPPPSVSNPETPATLLYIEDNASNVQVIQMVVSRLRPHWRFLSARDGESGLQQAREHWPTIVLLDLQLPGMNGDEVLAELRSRSETAEIPVLLLSADAMQHSRERLLALGANDYLAKPFNVNELLRRLDALLGVTTP